MTVLSMTPMIAILLVSIFLLRRYEQYEQQEAFIAFRMLVQNCFNLRHREEAELLKIKILWFLKSE